MEEKIIIDVLKKWNLWERKIDTGIKRKKYLKKVYPYLDRKEVIVLKGIRRAGKSTIAKQLMYELIKNKVGKKQILYLNLEDYNFSNNLNIGLFEDVLKSYKNYSGNNKKIYFFIDEIQKVSGWEKWVRTKYDLNENIKFIITGSSASLLSKEFSTLLTGRNISFKISPLSYTEFLKFSKNKRLDDYLEFGGFPEVVLEKDKNKKLVILQQYFDDIIHKDIIDRYEIRETKQLIEIARYLISTAGSKVSYNKLSKIFGLTKETIAKYVGYMIDAFLLFEVTFFSYSAKTKHDVSKLSKLYSIDNGLINTVSIRYSKNKGQMFENTVLIKLLDYYKEVSYWCVSRSEVDFIVEDKAINVTSTDRIPDREFKGLDTFIKKHKRFETFIVTKSKTKDNLISLKNFLKKEFF